MPDVAGARLAAPEKSLRDSQRRTLRARGFRRRVTAEVVPKLPAVPDTLNFLDETGAPWGLTWRLGGTAPSQRVVEANPGCSGAHARCCPGLNGVSAPWVLAEAMNAASSETEMEGVLGPTLRRGEIVVPDKWSVHESARACQWIEARVPRVQFLPPGSSDFNPIAWNWSKVKAASRPA